MATCQHCHVKNYISLTAWDNTVHLACTQLGWGSRRQRSKNEKKLKCIPNLAAKELKAMCFLSRFCHFTLELGCSLEKAMDCPPNKIKRGPIQSWAFNLAVHSQGFYTLFKPEHYLITADSNRSHINILNQNKVLHYIWMTQII